SPTLTAMSTHLLEHRYGEKVTILDSPALNGLLAQLSAQDTVQPRINQLLRRLYGALFRSVIDHEATSVQTTTQTRMAEFTDKGVASVTAPDPKERWVLVDLARAGMIPAEVCFDLANELIDPANVRVDHVFINRQTDENEQVTGTHVSGNKIGGDVDDVVLVFPDPMGATGSSICDAVKLYRNEIEGTPKRIVCAHLIVTPEYLRRLTDEVPEARIHALRLDRGLSPEDVLATTPGERWEEERGLNERQYIVPGAGGLGEVINNSFV
ncbi:MAG: uracil phosphoribosyltransferase, partial [Opitutales bacterium]